MFTCHSALQFHGTFHHSVDDGFGGFPFVVIEQDDRCLHGELGQ